MSDRSGVVGNAAVGDHHRRRSGARGLPDFGGQQLEAAGSTRPQGQPHSVGPPELACAVTVLCADRRTDLTIPSYLPCAELVPMLVRLLVRTGSGRTDRGGGHSSEPARDGLTVVTGWRLSVVGHPPLQPAETLAAAGVLDGDLLELGRSVDPAPPPLLAGTVRDRIEDEVEWRAGFWTERTSQALVHVMVIAVAIGLLVPVLQLPLGIATVGLAGTVAAGLAVLSATMAGRSAAGCAAITLAVGCAWAWLAGAGAVAGGTTGTSAVGLGPPGSVAAELLGAFDALSAGVATVRPFAVLLAGAVAALLLAVCSVVRHPTALSHAALLAVLTVAIMILAMTVLSGVPLAAAGGVTAVVAVLAIGGLPRGSMVVGGLVHAGPVDQGGGAVVNRFVRSDRILTGWVAGVSLVAAAAVVPAALADANRLRLLAAGVALTLLLRSRLFSQISHAIGPRIAGPLVVAVLWIGAYRHVDPLEAALLLITATGTVVLSVVLVGRRLVTPLGRARTAKWLGATEQVLITVSVLLAAGDAGLFDWISRVLA